MIAATTPSDKVWLALLIAVIVFELFGDKDDLMSDAAQRYCRRHPILARALPLGVVLHLIGWMPPQWDVFTRGGAHKTTLRRILFVFGAATIVRHLIRTPRAEVGV